VNKSQLVDAVAQKTGQSASAAGESVAAVLEAITEALVAKDKVTIPGFGTFETRDRAARTGRNPQTGEAIEVAASTVPAFKAGSDLKKKVSGK
jgi:DNA-binding protein HU-beta